MDCNINRGWSSRVATNQRGLRSHWRNRRATQSSGWIDKNPPISNKIGGRFWVVKPFNVCSIPVASCQASHLTYGNQLSCRYLRQSRPETRGSSFWICKISKVPSKSFTLLMVVWRICRCQGIRKELVRLAHASPGPVALQGLLWAWPGGPQLDLMVTIALIVDYYWCYKYSRLLPTVYCDMFPLCFGWDLRIDLWDDPLWSAAEAHNVWMHRRRPDWLDADFGCLGLQTWTEIVGEGPCHFVVSYGDVRLFWIDLKQVILIAPCFNPGRT